MRVVSALLLGYFALTALAGDQLAALAAANGWTGIVVMAASAIRAR